MTPTVAQVAAWRAKQRAKGLCRACKEPEHKAGLCEMHYAEHCLQNKVKGQPNKNKYKCSLCGEVGHNKQRCPRKEVI